VRSRTAMYKSLYHLLAKIVFAMGLFFAVARSASQAQVILSEIMYDPQNTDTNREWVEIFNTGASAVNIGGWQFGLPILNDWANAIPANTMLNAGQALVLTLPSVPTRSLEAYRMGGEQP